MNAYFLSFSAAVGSCRINDQIIDALLALEDEENQ